LRKGFLGLGLTRLQPRFFVLQLLDLGDEFLDLSLLFLKFLKDFLVWFQLEVLNLKIGDSVGVVLTKIERAKE